MKIAHDIFVDRADQVVLQVRQRLRAFATAAARLELGARGGAPVLECPPEALDHQRPHVLRTRILRVKLGNFGVKRGTREGTRGSGRKLNRRRLELGLLNEGHAPHLSQMGEMTDAAAYPTSSNALISMPKPDSPT